ncbi:ABC-type Fe3+-siderophore transport system, permease component [Marinovum algicola DG 898]|nr:ABC-type Fe3+-siderophore transport system, permease component [Marinovum algicola DG 898]
MSDARRPEFPDLRGPVTLALLGVLLPALMFAGLFAGAIPLEIETVVNSLLGRDGPRQDFIVLQSRLPRALLAALAGGALALSGALIQALMRNPLASPKIVGINSGAAFAVLVTAFYIPALPHSLLPVPAALGGLMAGALVWWCAQRGDIDPRQLTLVGLAVGLTLDAGVDALLVANTGPESSAPLIWLTGSLWGRGWTHLASVAPVLLTLAAAALILAFRLDLQALGPRRAAGLGVRVGLERTLALLAAVILASVAVSVVGVLGFVGLMAPHVATRLVGGRHRIMLPTAALFGAVLTVGADTLGRAIRPPLEISAGILTALMGAASFIWLLIAEDRRI